MITKFEVGHKIEIQNSLIQKVNDSKDEIHPFLKRVVYISHSHHKVVENKTYKVAYEIEKIEKNILMLRGSKELGFETYYCKILYLNDLIEVNGDNLYENMYHIFEFYISKNIEESNAINYFDKLGKDIYITASCFNFIFYHVLKYIKIQKIKNDNKQLTLTKMDEKYWKMTDEKKQQLYGIVIVPDLLNDNFEETINYLTVKFKNYGEEDQCEVKNKIVTDIMEFRDSDKKTMQIMSIECFVYEDQLCEVTHKYTNVTNIESAINIEFDFKNKNTDFICKCPNCTEKNQKHLVVARIPFDNLDEISDENENIIDHNHSIFQNITLSSENKYWINYDNKCVDVLKVLNSTVRTKFLPINFIEYDIFKMILTPNLTISFVEGNPLFNFMKRTQKYMKPSFVYNRYNADISSYHKFENTIYVWQPCDKGNKTFENIQLRIENEDVHFDGFNLYFLDPILEHVTFTYNGKQFFFAKKSIEKSQNYHKISKNIVLQKTKFTEGSNNSYFSSCFNNALL